MIMVGHPIYTAIDPELPASISPAVLDLLRLMLPRAGGDLQPALPRRLVL